MDLLAQLDSSSGNESGNDSEEDHDSRMYKRKKEEEKEKESCDSKDVFSTIEEKAKKAETKKLQPESESESSSTATRNEKKRRKKRKMMGSVSIIHASEASSTIFVRNIPHRRGHWSGHITVPITSCLKGTRDVSRSVRQFQRKLELCGNSGTIVEHDNYHLSLSRYFTLQIASIEPFVSRLSQRLKGIYRTRLFVESTMGSLLVNDDKTRSFWGWKVQPNETLRYLVRCVDEVLDCYNQPPYYDPPIFHISLASYAGNLQNIDECESSSDGSSNDDDDGDNDDNLEQMTLDSIPVHEIHCKFGTTKNYIIPLKSH